MNYLKQIQSLESEVYNKMGMYYQFTIDMIQGTEEELNRENDDQVKSDDLGSISYSISTALEIFNPEMKQDIETLKRLQQIIANWQREFKPV